MSKEKYGRSKKLSNTVVSRSFIILMVIGLLAGCEKSGNVAMLSEDKSLTIAYFSADMFRDRYKNVIEQKFPKLSLSIVPITDILEQSEQSEDQSAKNSVDIIYVPSENMKQFIDNGQIIDLDPLIKSSSLDVSLYEPEIIDYSRNFGNGKLYGIPTSLLGKVLVYNKEVFDANRINYPNDGMDWDDLLSLAQQFPENGLVIDYLLPSEIIWEIGRIRGLKAYQTNPEQISVMGLQWEEIWKLLAEPMKSGTVSFDNRPFFEGKAAMAIMNGKHERDIEANEKWATVTMPIDPNQPEVTTHSYIDGFYAISSSSKSVEESFELLKFLLSPELSRLEEASMQQAIPVLKKETRSKAVQSMLKLKPVFYEALPFEFNKFGESTMNKIVIEDIPVDQALGELQDQLDQWLLNKNR
ncbi:multiple sugar transport system substrate-binding protein [Paenibacillus harenae]|uniref:Multiple sugar transport system substrate-binding protein n=2 Tax=Paenibacillus harenae TaxID=306543 RepID=A0ABT9U1G2_PAEHA|nr:multiple sugar transport system substrate-binding protein [Paenibacillus harenae]